jgi:hypothetical protein
MTYIAKKRSLLTRLLGKIKIDEHTDCWEWQGGKNNVGYGMIRHGDKMRTAHRVSYEEHTQTTILPDMCVMHSCDNPCCVNPQHLSLGTHKDNSQDMVKKGRANYGLTHRLGIKHRLSTCTVCGIEKPVNTIGRYHNNKCTSKQIQTK